MIVLETVSASGDVSIWWYSTFADARDERPLMSADAAVFTTHRPGWEATTLRPIVDRVHTMIRDWDPVAKGVPPWHPLITHRRGLWGHMHLMADVVGAPHSGGTT